MGDFQHFNSWHFPAHKKIQTIQNRCKRQQVLHLRWPVAKVSPRQEQEVMGDKAAKESPILMPPRQSAKPPGRVPWTPAQLSSGPDRCGNISDTHFHSRIKANSEGKKKEYCWNLSRPAPAVSMSVGHVTDCRKAGAQAKQGTFHRRCWRAQATQAGFQHRVDTPAARCAQANRRCLLRPAPDQGGLSRAKAAVPNARVHLRVQMHSMNALEKLHKHNWLAGRHGLTLTSNLPYSS